MSMAQPDYDPIAAAQVRRAAEVERAQRFTAIQAQSTPASADKNMDLLLAEVRELRQMIEGATIACSGGGVTLTWGT